MPIFPEDDESIHATPTPSYATERFRRQIEELLFLASRLEFDIDDDTQFSDLFRESSSEWEEFKDAVKKTYDVDAEIEDCFWEVAEKMNTNGF
jgi:hypothetical protein